MSMSWMETVRYIGLDLQLMTLLGVAGVTLAVRAFKSVRRGDVPAFSSRLIQSIPAFDVGPFFEAFDARVSVPRGPPVHAAARAATALFRFERRQKTIQRAAPR